MTAVQRFLLPVCAVLALAAPLGAFATLKPEATLAFDRYVASVEAAMDRDLKSGQFLRLDRRPDLKAKLRSGELNIESGALGRESLLKAPDAMIQDWLGS